MDNERTKFALLIDSDNISSRYIDGIIAEITTKYGDFSYKRIYGDWTQTQNNAWKKVLLTYSLKPVQQFSNTVGKNATDSALIIDAMDILYTGNVDGFCIVSSDSDFTSLAQRLSESSKMVIGMGEKKTPASFRNACTQFIMLENLMDSDDDSLAEAVVPDEADGATLTREAVADTVEEILRSNEQRGFQNNLADLGNRLISRYPDFDVRAFGYNQLSKFLNSFEQFELVPPDAPNAVALKRTTMPDTAVRELVFSEVQRSGDTGCGLAYLGQLIKREFPDFRTKDFGYAKLSSFLQDIPGLVLHHERDGEARLYPLD